VDYAQGFLFGEPRAVRDDAQRGADSVMAAAAGTAAVLPLRKAS
jgi:hypothetical protein